MHASWNALVKSGGDRLLSLFTVIGTCGVVASMFLPFVEPPARESWLCLFLSVVIHSAYYLFLLLAYRTGDLSHVYPFMRGIAPVMVAGLAWLVAGETLSVGKWAGVWLVSLGILSLTFNRGMPDRHEAKSLFYAFLTGLTITAYTVVDGMGVRQSGSPFGYIAWLFALDVLPLIPVIYLLRRKTFFTFMKTGWKRGAMGGVIALAAYGIVIWAMSLNQMAYVSALRETSVIIAAMIGHFLLDEGFGKARIASSCIVALGAILMSLY